MKRLGITRENRHKNSLKVRAANDKCLEVWGFMPVTLEVNGMMSQEIMYFAAGVRHLLIRRGALQRFGCLSSVFPEPVVRSGGPKPWLGFLGHSGESLYSVCTAPKQKWAFRKNLVEFYHL